MITIKLLTMTYSNEMYKKMAMLNVPYDLGVPPRLFSIGVDTDPSKLRRNVAFPMATDLGIGNRGGRQIMAPPSPDNFPMENFPSKLSSDVVQPSISQPFAPNVSFKDFKVKRFQEYWSSDL